MRINYVQKSSILLDGTGIRKNTECVTKSCESPDWLIQTCYQSASLCVTEMAFFYLALCEMFSEKFYC